MMKMMLFLWFISFVGCNDSTYMQGKRLYVAHCQNCHMEDGSGLGELIPSLTKSEKLGSVLLSCVIKNGVMDTIFRDSIFLLKQMPSFKKLSATEVTNIVNYINSEWYKPFREITILEIEKTLKNCH